MILTFEGYRPSPRYPPENGLWTQARIERSELSTGPWVTIEGPFALIPAVIDPANPPTYNFTTDLAVITGWYRIVFIDAAGNTDQPTVPQTIGTPGVGYPSTATLVAASSADELLALSGAQKDALRDLAINAVERYTGQRFTPSTTDVVIDGSGSREIFTPIRVEALTGVLVKGTSIDVTDVVLGAKGDRLHFAAWNTSYAVMAMRETAYDTRTFRSGSGMVILSGTFGWSVCPPAVAQALRIEMEVQAAADASALSGIVASARRLGMTNLSQGNLRAAIGDPSEISPQAARLLSDYVWLGAGGYLA